MRHLIRVTFLVLLLAATAQGDAIFGGGGGSSGDLDDPLITGTSTDFYDSLLKIEDGGDRSVFKGDVLEFRDTDNDPILHLHGTNAHRQVTTLNADIWMEPGSGGSAEGSLVYYNKTGRIGWSVQQQDDLPGFHAPLDIALGRNLYFIPSGESTTLTLDGTDVTKLGFSGTLAGGNQLLAWHNTKGMTWKSNAAGDKYLELYLGYSSINKMQTNVDVWINDAKFVSYSSTAAKARVGDLTLSSGTVTVTNTNNDANDKLFLQMKTPGGTLCHGYKYSISAGTSFTVTAVNADRTDCTTDTSTLSWWLINKQ